VEQWNQVTTAVGYASASEPTVQFGLGGSRVASRVEVQWPSGERQVLTDVDGDKVVTITEP
jgi:enediyne biosynthesis protein E4